jgi:hypothetical protein
MYAAYHDCDPLKSNVSTTMTLNCTVFWDTIPCKIVKLPLFMPLSYIGELAVGLHSLTSTLDGGEWPASFPGHFMFRAPITHRLGCWVDHSASMDPVEQM